MLPGAGAGAGADQKCHGSASLVKTFRMTPRPSLHDHWFLRWQGVGSPSPETEVTDVGMGTPQAVPMSLQRRRGGGETSLPPSPLRVQ